MACLVRVPTDVVKQKMQAGIDTTTMNIVGTILKTDGVRGFFNGYGITIFREIPFSFIQFPLYEQFKVRRNSIEVL